MWVIGSVGTAPIALVVRAFQGWSGLYSLDSTQQGDKESW